MYRHTQIGWVMLVCFGAALVLMAVLAAVLPPPQNFPARIVLALLFFALLLFCSLTVLVDDTCIEVRFGVGLLRRTFLLAEVRSARPVRNRWWYGWGLRWGPRGWLFNVSGLDAVELEMKDGRCYRIGTDDPERLAQAIQRSLTTPES